MAVLYFFAFMLASLVSGALGSPIAPVHLDRARRSDDTYPLQVVVDHLSQQVVQMQAQIQANKNNLDSLQQAVGFTVRMKETDVHGLGDSQVIKFDDVIYNAGNSYNPGSGIFTAPAAGTYVFFLQTLRHYQDVIKIEMNIMKNNVFLTVVHAGYSPWESGSILSVTHLNQGDTIEVQNRYGGQFWGGLYTTFAGFRVSSL